MDAGSSPPVLPLQGTPKAEFAVDEALVAALLAEQHPDLAGLALSVVDEGWDNVMFRLGEDFAVRVPRRAAAAKLIEHELAWLPRIAPDLPIAVPAPAARGRARLRLPVDVERAALDPRDVGGPRGAGRRRGAWRSPRSSGRCTCPRPRRRRAIPSGACRSPTAVPWSRSASRASRRRTTLVTPALIADLARGARRADGRGRHLDPRRPARAQRARLRGPHRRHHRLERHGRGRPRDGPRGDLGTPRVPRGARSRRSTRAASRARRRGRGPGAGPSPSA